MYQFLHLFGCAQVAKLSIGMENLQAAETCVEELTRKLGDTEHQYLAQLANVQEEKDVMREQINALTEQVCRASWSARPHTRVGSASKKRLL
jgi:hypothetical protein